MGKTLSLKMNDKELKKVDLFLKEKDMTPSGLLRKALWSYVNEVNQKVNLNQQEKNHEKVNLEINQVNHKIQITENYELMEYLKHDHEWLKDRIEHFEHAQDIILAKIDTKQVKEKTSVSWIRM